MHNEHLTVDEAAVLLQINRQTVEMWLSEGLQHERRGDEMVIRREDLDAFLLRNGQGVSRDAALED
ncbi:MAG: Helix-turn-helix domain [Chloroflexota bacterium]|jgi:excisionase family DNA binding protein